MIKMSGIFPSKPSMIGSIIACIITWYVLKIDGLIPTIIATAIGGFIGEIYGHIGKNSQSSESTKRAGNAYIKRPDDFNPKNYWDVHGVKHYENQEEKQMNSIPPENK